MGKFTANRVVLILHSVILVLTLIGVFITTTTNSLPVSWQKTAAAAGVLIAVLITGTTAVVKYLDGSQKSEALQVHAQMASNVPPAPSPPRLAREADVPDSGHQDTKAMAPVVDDPVEEPNLATTNQTTSGQLPADEDGEPEEEGPPPEPENLDSARWLANRQPGGPEAGTP